LGGKSSSNEENARELSLIQVKICTNNMEVKEKMEKGAVYFNLVNVILAA
jgi:hypothetical protein